MIELLHVSKGQEAERSCWTKWLRAADNLRGQCLTMGDGSFDPFWYGETALVGLLTAAAGKAGLIGLPEFTEELGKDQIKAGQRAGRCDLWLNEPLSGADWLFEFKVCWAAPSSGRGLKTKMKAAIDAVHKRLPNQAARKFAAVIYNPWAEKAPSGRYSKSVFKAVEHRIRILANQVDLAFVMTGARTVKPIFFLFKEVGGADSPTAYYLD